VWLGDAPANRFVPYEMRADLHATGDGRLAATMVLPGDALPETGEAVLTADYFRVNPFAGGVTLEGDGGTLSVQPINASAAVCRIDVADLRRIAHDHRPLTVRLTMPPERSRNLGLSLVLAVREKSS
jgi:hypothetical protein